MKKRLGYSMMIVAALFFGLNYSWAHAAVVSFGSSSDCPEQAVLKAERRVETLFGEVQSSPIFTCIEQPKLGLDVSYGTSRFAPALPAIIVLGPEGQNIDVTSHEFAHAELAERTSVLVRTYKIPTWFDEGLAMQMDERPDFSKSALQDYIAREGFGSLTLSDIASPNTFFRADERGKMHYAFSRCVVGQWLKNSEPHALDELIETGIGWTKEFPSHQFSEYETLCNGATGATGDRD